MFGQTSQDIKLIVRGDDMGFSHSGNLALIKSYREGIESSIEVIVPSPWFPEAVSMLAENPGIDVGVHLALTSEWDLVKWRPMTEAKSIRDVDGYFYPMVNPNKNYPLRSLKEVKWDLNEIEKEFRAQIETCLRKIPRTSHISSHMGCTRLDPVIHEMTKRLANEYHLIYESENYPFLRANYQGPSGQTAEKIESFIQMLAQLQPGKTYCFVDHPGLDDPELRAISHVGYENVAMDRQGVTDLFTSKKVRDFIKSRGIQLIGYRELGPRP